MLLLISIRVAEYHRFGKELFIRLTLRVFRERLSICVFACFFSFGFESGMWDLIVLVTYYYLFTLPRVVS